MLGRAASKLNVDLAAIVPKAGLPAAVAEQIAAAPDTLAALAILEESDCLVEATRLIAHALPRREAVWWACMCARHTSPPSLPAPDQAALAAAETWVRTQADDVRRAAFDHAQRADFKTPEAWAAVSAYWSGDSIAPLGQTPVPPPAHVAAAAVAGAVALASVRDRPERRSERLQRFIESARDIARGGVGELPAEKEAE